MRQTIPFFRLSNINFAGVWLCFILLAILVGIGLSVYKGRQQKDITITSYEFHIRSGGFDAVFYKNVPDNPQRSMERDKQEVLRDLDKVRSISFPTEV